MDVITHRSNRQDTNMKKMFCNSTVKNKLGCRDALIATYHTRQARSRGNGEKKISNVRNQDDGRLAQRRTQCCVSNGSLARCGLTEDLRDSTEEMDSRHCRKAETVRIQPTSLMTTTLTKGKTATLSSESCAIQLWFIDTGI